jgi:hypothetical protein
MRRVFRAIVAVGALAVPAAAQAQRTGGTHEVGVDVALAWVKPSGVDAMLSLSTPVDVRIGLASRGPLSLEPRVSVFLVVDGGTRYDIDPGLNALYRMGGTSVNHNTYVTFGADIDLRKAGTSGAVFALNGGYGMRRPWGAGALRTEFFLRYAFEDTAIGAPNTLSLGVRAGLSLWH